MTYVDFVEGLTAHPNTSRKLDEWAALLLVYVPLICGGSPSPFDCAAIEIGRASGRERVFGLV